MAGLNRPMDWRAAQPVEFSADQLASSIESCRQRLNAWQAEYGRGDVMADYLGALTTLQTAVLQGKRGNQTRRDIAAIAQRFRDLMETVDQYRCNLEHTAEGRRH